MVLTSQGDNTRKKQLIQYVFSVEQEKLTKFKINLVLESKDGYIEYPHEKASVHGEMNRGFLLY